MIQFTAPVKFLGTHTRTGKTNGRDWEMVDAFVFVADVGKVQIATRGTIVFPNPGDMINLMLSVDQGKYQALVPIWDENAKFKRLT